MRDCPNFPTCSAPKCPLDPEMESRVFVEREHKCTLKKSLRMKYGQNLATKGLVGNELGAYRRWIKKTEEAKKSFSDKGKKHHF